MQVEKSKTIHIDNEHSIEFGRASWDPNVETVRRRKNRVNGSFDPYSSSEIPLNDFVDLGYIVCECLKQDKIKSLDMINILKEIAASMLRQRVAFP